MVRRHICMEPEMAAGGTTLSASNEMLALLGSQDWEPMLKELLCYAMTRIKDREWLSVWGGQPPGAKEAHDVVMDSVIDVIDGIRRMPEGVPIIAFLKFVVRSKISHLVECLENKRTTRIPADGDELDFQWDGAAPDSETVSDETEKQNSRLLDLLIEDLSDDPDLQKVIECNLDGIFKREEVASRLGRSVAEVTNMKKRLDRRMNGFRAKYADQNPFLEGSK
jgi:DNA-directed RNA polymerase specialized sigma24 family protein